MQHVYTYRRFLLENIKFIENKDSIPQMESYDIVWNGEQVGVMDLSYLSGELQEDEIEIAYFAIKPRYRAEGLSLGRKAVESIWQEFPQAEKIYLQSVPEARGFWQKMGARDSAEREHYQVIRRPR